ncbi:MAG: hypothetical protein HWN67_05205 [Candidatus Helarchaeota archaeon]|nr:hypothetical protein [Candidatus Helarchaeota archaeon]
MLEIRENKKSVGTVKIIGERIKLKYHDRTIKIKERPSAIGNIIKIDEETYQFLENEVRKWPSKEKLIIVKSKYGRTYFKTPTREKVMKAKILNNIIKLKFFKEPTDIIIYLFSVFRYLVK